MKDSDYYVALDNIKQFYFIGNINRFDQDINSLSYLLGWNNIPTYGRDNSNPERRHKKELNREELNLIEKTQYYDISFYNKLKNDNRTLH